MGKMRGELTSGVAGTSTVNSDVLSMMTMMLSLTSLHVQLCKFDFTNFFPNYFNRAANRGDP